MKSGKELAPHCRGLQIFYRVPAQVVTRLSTIDFGRGSEVRILDPFTAGR